MPFGFIAKGLFLLENYLMKDLINTLIKCGFDFDMAIILSENYQEDFSPILHENYVGEVSK